MSPRSNLVRPLCERLSGLRLPGSKKPPIDYFSRRVPRQVAELCRPDRSVGVFAPFVLDVYATRLAAHAQAEALFKHREQSFRTLRTCLESAAYRQAAELVVIHDEPQGRISTEFLDDITQGLVLEVHCALSPCHRPCELCWRQLSGRRRSAAQVGLLAG